MSVCCRSVLVALLAVLPIGVAPPLRAEPLDLDGDGQPEHIEESRDAGTGWSMTGRCITHGASGDQVCRHFERSAYSAFEGVRTRLVPADADPAALALLEPLDCVAPEPDSPTQAAMWLLGKDDPLVQAPELEALVWHPGAPREQVAVCLSVEEARALHGGLMWEPSGELAPLAPGEALVVRYAARGWDAGDGARPDPALQERLTVGTMRFLIASQALAVYDSERDRHAWLLNFAGGSDDAFKVDRHARITDLSVDEATHTLRITLATHGQDRSLHLELAALH